MMQMLWLTDTTYSAMVVQIGIAFKIYSYENLSQKQIFAWIDAKKFDPSAFTIP